MADQTSAPTLPTGTSGRHGDEPSSSSREGDAGQPLHTRSASGESLVSVTAVSATAISPTLEPGPAAGDSDMLPLVTEPKRHSTFEEASRSSTARGRKGRLAVEYIDRDDSDNERLPPACPKGLRTANTHGQRSAGTAVGEPLFKFAKTDNNRLERERIVAMIDPSYMTWSHRWFAILEGQPHEQDRRLTFVFNATSIFFILLNCTVFLLQSLPENTDNGTGTLQQGYLMWLEIACIVFFVTEALLRLLCVPRSQWFTWLFIVDILTIVGNLADVVSLTGFGSVFSPLRLVRVFRILKLSWYSSNLQLVFTVLRTSVPGLAMLAIPLVLVALVAASIIFYCEIWNAKYDTESRLWIRDGSAIQIQDLPDALWYTMVTITTVGYGDIVPQTVMGKFFGVLVMFTGVLTLSFPNIVLAVNLQRELRKRSRRLKASRQFLPLKKVLHAIAFIRRARYWIAIRKARQAALSRAVVVAAPQSKSAPRDEFEARANFAFFPTAADFESLRRPTVEPVTVANLRRWTYKGADAVSILQTILEGFSGVATCQEVYNSLLDAGLSGDVHQKDIALCLYYLGEAEILKLFVLVRSTTQLLVALTETAVTELLLHNERGLYCHRSAEFARFTWKQTTGQLVPYSLEVLLPSYPVWASRERFAEDDTAPDLRTTIEATTTGRETTFGGSASFLRLLSSRGDAAARVVASGAMLREGSEMLKALLHDTKVLDLRN